LGFRRRIALSIAGRVSGRWPEATARVWLAGLPCAALAFVGIAWPALASAAALAILTAVAILTALVAAVAVFRLRQAPKNVLTRHPRILRISQATFGHLDVLDGLQCQVDLVIPRDVPTLVRREPPHVLVSTVERLVKQNEPQFLIAQLLDKGWVPSDLATVRVGRLGGRCDPVR
jgi:hypothetical protein